MKALTHKLLSTALQKAGLHEWLAQFRALRDLKSRLFADLHPLIRLFSTGGFGPIEPLRLMDIGARGGIQPRWLPLVRWLEVTGFEPDEVECARLNAHFSRNNEHVTIYARALSDASEHKTLYVTGSPNSSGLVKSDQSFVLRLQKKHFDTLRVVEERTIATLSIDDFLADQSVKRPDFIKIDVEGAEPLVLAGARQLLANNSLLGVESEIWLGPIKNGDNLSRIDMIMRGSRFHLFDLVMRRYPRRSFPHGFLASRGPYRKSNSEQLGQPLTGDILYLRDPVWELEKGLSGFDWTDSTVVKMALIFSIYDLPDCAIELLTTYSDNFNSKLPFELMFDALTPVAPSGRRLKYRQYLARTKR